MHGEISVKSDVFSFGVLLLEIISGKGNNSFYDPDKPDNLLTSVSIAKRKLTSVYSNLSTFAPGTDEATSFCNTLHIVLQR